MWGALPPIISAFVGISGLLIAALRWRDDSLRRNDVLAWSNEVISMLESLVVVCGVDETVLGAEVAKAKTVDVIFHSAALVERGRLFFRNEIVDGYGADKEPAYRGHRPRILDPIVVAHQIACGWGAADETTRARMREIAEDCLKKFVSLAQKEVGRSRTASADTKHGGEGLHLRHLLHEGEGRGAG